jgi:DNA-binding FadR family transcriptional regulator
MLGEIKRNSLVSQVIDSLTAQIQKGNWPVGSKLPPENALASELMVGRSTIREAVRVLAHNGLLEVRQGAGTFVISTQPSTRNAPVNPSFADNLQNRLRRAKILDVYEVRRPIEVEAARLAALRRDEDDLARIQAAYDRRQSARSSPESGPYIKADIDFHIAVVDAAHNPILSDLFSAFIEALHDALLLLDQETSRDFDTSGAHYRLAQAIIDADPDAAVAATLEHLDDTARLLRASDAAS